MLFRQLVSAAARFRGRTREASLACLVCCCTVLISCGGGGGDVAAGFEIKTDSGIVQVDSTYKNLALIGKYSVSTTTYNGVVYRGSFTAPAGSNRVFALRSSVPALVSMVVGDVVTITSTAATTLDVFVFADTPATVEASGAGLVVYNAAGEITFSSNMRYMRVAGAALVPNGYGAFNYSSLPSGTYAAALSAPRWWLEHQGAGGIEYWVYRDFVRTHATGAEVSPAYGQIIPQGASVTGPTESLTGGQLLIFDVSGY